MVMKKFMIYILTVFVATSCVTPKIAYATEWSENIEANTEFTSQDVLNELETIKDNNESVVMSGSEWLQNSLTNNDFAVDISSLNLVEMPSNLDTFANDYQNKLDIMKEMGYGKRSELEIKNNDGYTESAMDLFQDKYGELFLEGLQFERTEIPSNFNVSKMFEEASKARDEAYEKVMNSSDFQSVKNSIGISNITNVPSYFEEYSNVSISSLKNSLGISTDLSEIAGFSDLKSNYNVDFSEYIGDYNAKKDSAKSEQSKNSPNVENLYNSVKDKVKEKIAEIGSSEGMDILNGILGN